MATSSGPAERTGRSDASPEPSVEPPLSAPNRMLTTERPIAVAISLVRNVPDAPTPGPNRVGGERPGRPTRVAGHQQQGVAEHVATRRDGQTRERVEQG